MHNGDIKVESKLNAGTTITFLIPAGKEHYKPEDLKEKSTFSITDQNLYLHEIEDISPDESNLFGTCKNSTILIVDDDMDLNNYLSSLLAHNYNIVQAFNGEKALLITLQKLPDLIICDIILPGINGVEFCKRIKSNHATSHIPVMLISAITKSEFEMIGLESGANDYISKPFNPEIILLKVDNQFNYLSCLREKYHKTISLDPGIGEIEDVEVEFLNKAMQICEKHISDSNFTNKKFEVEIGMSKSQLYKKLTLLTGLSPNKFIRYMRLKRAAHLLKKSYKSIAEITYDVGFNDLKYFRKIFTEKFGMSPSEYKKSGKSHNI
jgi:DNA-binding response OmpR family regulator